MKLLELNDIRGAMEEATGKAHILVVDDEPEVRAALRLGLEESGYIVSEAGSMKSLVERLENSPDIRLITLDLVLGNEDGLQLARQIRARRNIPIVMVTARDDPIDRVLGLEHGADDYIVKPFHIREVLMRVASVLRRYELEGIAGTDPAPTPAALLECECGRLDPQSREFRGPDDAPVELTDAEFDILHLFLRHPGRVLSRDDLSMKLKGRRWSPLDRTIDGHIARLRKKIEPEIQAPRYIKTVWGVGYVFAVEVRRT